MTALPPEAAVKVILTKGAASDPKRTVYELGSNSEDGGVPTPFTPAIVNYGLVHARAEVVYDVATI